MSPRYLFATVAVAGLAVPFAAAAQTAPASIAKPAPVSELIKKIDIPYQRFTLPNGLRVLVHTDRKAPVVAVSVWYDVGSKHEPKGKTGFAHLFEHLMFNGSENAPGDFFEPLKQVGATDLNGTTSFDRTNYFETVPTPALEKALYLESDRMGYLLGAVTQAVLDEQRGVVQNEKRQGDNQPYGLLQYRIYGGLFPEGHPYSHTPIGSMADLDAASLDDVKTWFRSNYGPNNAVLVLAGDIDVATARPLVEKYFGGIAAGPKSQPPAIAIPTLDAPKAEVIKDRVAATLVTRLWAVPGLNDKESSALTAAAQVLGGLSSSRLQNALVRKEKLAVQVSTGVQALAQAGIFQVVMVVRPGVDAAVAGKRLDELIADFIRTGPTEDELQRTVTTAVSRRISGLESVGGFGGKAVALAEGELYSGDPAYYKKRLNDLAAQTPASVTAAMQKWLSRPVYAVSVVPGPRDATTDVAATPKPVAAPPEAKPMGTRPPAPTVGAVANLVFPKVERARLSNGIEVIYAQRTAVPVTRALISFDAGVVADPDGKLGTQQLTLSMLDEGTTTRDSIAIAEARERLGVSFGEGTSADRTYLSVAAPSANVAGALDLFADVVRNPAFAEGEVARLRATQLAGIQQELTNPQGLAGRVLPRLIYGPASPYAKTAAGSGDPAAVAKLTRDDLIAFQHAWLRPDKAKIFVVSDLPLAKLVPQLDRRFGSWVDAADAGVKAQGVAASPAAPKIVLIDRPDSPQSLITAGQLTPVKGSDDLLPIETANDVLGGDFLSRINLDLRETKHWSYGAGGRFAQNETYVTYRINAPVQADKTGESIAALRGDLADFLGPKGITADEFTRTINGATRELAGNFETAAAVLSAMLDNDQYRRPDNYYATLTAQYRAMTREGLDAAIRRALDATRFVWVVVGDAKVVRPQLDSLGLPVEVVPAASVAGAK
ncbi:pitrilysin family protein [Sphingomonas sp.]|uniref:M16 family metallopeptidase n=1 Tax=Sphingomonas sp. TaxID=28214 RepID=UPI001D6DD3B7|nr:pitrilysin family protein [Sphingomonas sp.]MBX9796891.1 insulinase family protein [Sphingomonas sp.]